MVYLSKKTTTLILTVCLLLNAECLVAQQGGGGGEQPSEGGEQPSEGGEQPSEGGETEQGGPQDTDYCALDGSDTYMAVTVDAETRTVESSGCPNYDWSSQTTPGGASDNGHVNVFPVEPVVCTEPTAYVGVYWTNDNLTDANMVGQGAVQGAIGVAFNGVPIFGNADGARVDAYISEGHTFNQCNGHSGPGGGYHYHAQVPDECLLEQPTEGAHSDLFGILADGIPIYGPLGDNGEVPTDLDECNGHTDETHSFYHYHVASDYEYPYIVNCLKGQVDFEQWSMVGSAGGAEDCTAAEEQYDYSFLETDFATLDL